MAFLDLKIKKDLTWNFVLFLHMQLNFEIIWTRIGEITWLQNDIDFSEALIIL